MTDKKEEELTKVSKWEEVVKYFEEDESPAEKNQREYGRTNVMKGKKQPDIPTSGTPRIVAAVEGTDQQSLYNTMFGHIFRKYRTLV
jgi:hypothetical protein